MKDNVLRLKISMNDLICMHIIECSADLLHYIFGHLFWYSTLLLKKTVKLSWKAKLKHEIDVGFICKEGVHLNDVLVTKKTLDFYLPHQLDDQFAIHIAFLYFF